jgi:hypothetical protein
MGAASAYWPWWAVSISLGAITVGYWIAVRRPLGISGIVARFATPRQELEAERQEASRPAAQAALEAALLAATVEAFGPAVDAPPGATAPAGGRAVPPRAGCARALGPTPTLGCHATFLLALAAGGLLSQVLRGSWRLQLLDPTFEGLVGSTWTGVAALLGGGVLVGFGTCLCAGCTAGHGLSGCSRLQPGSLVATATFMAAAVGVSLLLLPGGVP